eukprot:m.301516 g.301516  ORF g.301516 m.301516 type:complete len:110 (+) comp55226_c0_seq3:311-640(+)
MSASAGAVVGSAVVVGSAAVSSLSNRLKMLSIRDLPFPGRIPVERLAQRWPDELLGRKTLLLFFQQGYNVFMLIFFPERWQQRVHSHQGAEVRGNSESHLRQSNGERKD